MSAPEQRPIVIQFPNTAVFGEAQADNVFPDGIVLFWQEQNEYWTVSLQGVVDGRPQIKFTYFGTPSSVDFGQDTAVNLFQSGVVLYWPEKDQYWSLSLTGSTPGRPQLNYTNIATT